MVDIDTIPAERSDLATHVQMCEMRHKEVAARLGKIEADTARMKRIEFAVYLIGAGMLGGGFLTVERLNVIAAAAAKIIQ